MAGGAAGTGASSRQQTAANLGRAVMGLNCSAGRFLQAAGRWEPPCAQHSKQPRGIRAPSSQSRTPPVCCRSPCRWRASGLASWRPPPGPPPHCSLPLPRAREPPPQASTCPGDGNCSAAGRAATARGPASGASERRAPPCSPLRSPAWCPLRRAPPPTQRSWHPCSAPGRTPRCCTCWRSRPGRRRARQRWCSGRRVQRQAGRPGGTACCRTCRCRTLRWPQSGSGFCRQPVAAAAAGWQSRCRSRACCWATRWVEEPGPPLYCLAPRHWAQLFRPAVYTWPSSRLRASPNCWVLVPLPQDDWLEVAPQVLPMWQATPLAPFGRPKDLLHFLVCPEPQLAQAQQLVKVGIGATMGPPRCCSCGGNTWPPSACLFKLGCAAKLALSAVQCTYWK